MRDRTIRIHGHFKHVLEPLEKKLMERDRQIEHLKICLLRLEFSVFGTMDGICGGLDSVLAAKLKEVVDVKSQVDSLKAECGVLSSRKDTLAATVSSLAIDVEDAKIQIDELVQQRRLCTAKIEELQREKAYALEVMGKIDSFRNGKMIKAYEELMVKCERLQLEVDVLEERKTELTQSEAAPAVDSGDEDRTGGV